MPGEVLTLGTDFGQFCVPWRVLSQPISYVISKARSSARRLDERPADHIRDIEASQSHPSGNWDWDSTSLAALPAVYRSGRADQSVPNLRRPKPTNPTDGGDFCSEQTAELRSAPCPALPVRAPCRSSAGCASGCPRSRSRRVRGPRGSRHRRSVPRPNACPRHSTGSARRTSGGAFPLMTAWRDDSGDQGHSVSSGVRWYRSAGERGKAVQGKSQGSSSREPSGQPASPGIRWLGFIRDCRRTRFRP